MDKRHLGRLFRAMVKEAQKAKVEAEAKYIDEREPHRKALVNKSVVSNVFHMSREFHNRHGMKTYSHLKVIGLMQRVFVKVLGGDFPDRMEVSPPMNEPSAPTHAQAPSPITHVPKTREFLDAKKLDTHWQAYSGYFPYGDYVIYGRHRDSGCLQNTNYTGIFRDLKKFAEKFPVTPRENPSQYREDAGADAWVYDWQASCSLVGWQEHLAVRGDAPAEILDEVERILKKLDGYPVYSDDEYSQAEMDEIYEYWEGLSRKEKAQLCREAGVPIRRGRSMPEKVFDELRDTWR